MTDRLPRIDPMVAAVTVAICGLGGLAMAEFFGVPRLVAIGMAMVTSVTLIVYDLVWEEEIPT